MRNFRKRLASATALVVVLAGSFAWGYAAHRNHLFPYWPARSLVTALGLRVPPEALPRRNELLPDRRSWQDRLEALQALPYVSGTADPHAERRGVLLHDREHASPGLNLYAPATEAAAYLIDMDGRVAHRWSYGKEPWQHVELLPDGGLLATVTDRELLRLDRRSRLLWRYRARFHHDLALGPDGRIYGLVRNDRRMPELHPDFDTVVDSLLVLSPDGELVREASLLDVVLGSRYAYLVPRLDGQAIDRDKGALDLLHTNHVEVLDGSEVGRSPLFSRGNLVVSFRTLSTIAILDGESLDPLWVWGPNNLLYQHDPTLVPGGRLLIFDNGIHRSRVVELDPLTRKLAWTYTAGDLFSRTRGSVQRLPNGDTLITESDTGYVFEVTPAGERVWTFAAPHYTLDGRRASIWRMHRYPPGTAGF